MAPIKKKSIEEKLRSLQEVIIKLEECRKASQKDFLKDYRIGDIAKYNLILGIEIITDIGNHLLSEVFHLKTTDYFEIIKKLGEAKIVPQNLAQDNADMAKFRNLLIHEYIKVDPDKVYQNLQKAPDIFREFAKHYQEFLDKLC